MSRKTKYDSYDDRFKATAVELGDLPGVKAIDVAEILDIHPVMLYRWKKEYRDGDIVAKKAKGTLETEEKSELKRLRKIERDHKELLIKHDLLKKASNSVRIKKRNLRVHRNTERAVFTQNSL